MAVGRYQIANLTPPVEEFMLLLRKSETDEELKDVLTKNQELGESITVLSVVVCMQHLRAVKILLSLGVDVNENSYVLLPTSNAFETMKREPPLITACRMGDMDIATCLVKGGANVLSKACHNNSSALHVACDKGFLEIVDLLVRHGADINQFGDYRFTPLAEAVVENRLDIVKYLVDNGAKLTSETTIKNEEDDDDDEDDLEEIDGETPLSLAMVLGLTDIVRYLICAGSEIDCSPRTENAIISFYNHFIDESPIEFVHFLMLSGSAITPAFVCSIEFIGYKFPDVIAWLGENAKIPASLLQQCRITLRRHFHNLTPHHSILPAVRQLQTAKYLREYLELKII